VGDPIEQSFEGPTTRYHGAIFPEIAVKWRLSVFLALKREEETRKERDKVTASDRSSRRLYRFAKR